MTAHATPSPSGASEHEPRRSVTRSAPARSGQRERRPTTKAAPPAASNEAQSAQSAQSGAQSEQSAQSSAQSGAHFGAAGLPSGVRHLPRAFARALSIANRADTRWLALAPGAAGEARIELAVDADGKLGELEFADARERDALAPVVRHLLDNTRLLLESGHYSLDPGELRAGVARLRVRVEIVEREASADSGDDPTGLNELDWQAPAPGRPGHGSFTLNSGRRVIGWVSVE